MKLDQSASSNHNESFLNGFHFRDTRSREQITIMIWYLRSFETSTFHGITLKIIYSSISILVSNWIENKRLDSQTIWNNIHSWKLFRSSMQVFYLAYRPKSYMNPFDNLFHVIFHSYSTDVASGTSGDWVFSTQNVPLAYTFEFRDSRNGMRCQ